MPNDQQDRPPSQSPCEGMPPTDGIRVGIAGWTFPAWEGSFYPPGLARTEMLAFASRALSTLEINGTYYRAQSPATYRRWAAQTPAGFVMPVKAPRRLCQPAALGNTGPGVQAFLADLAALGDRLGPVLWQLGPVRGRGHDDLARFAALLPRAVDGLPLRHVLDLRDPTLADARGVGIAHDHGHATVCTDAPAYPRFADAAPGLVYLRLMRSAEECDTGYPPATLARWVPHLRAWAAGGSPDGLPMLAPAPPAAGAPRDVFVVFVGAAKARNPAAAVALQRQLAAGHGHAAPDAAVTGV